jgi:hypothetical protein
MFVMIQSKAGGRPVVSGYNDHTFGFMGETLDGQLPPLVQAPSGEQGQTERCD